MKKFTVLDLFCGCGGMSWGLHKNGFNVVAGIDTWEPALNTFQLNHPEAIAINANLTELKPGDLLKKIPILKKTDLDCIIGGPPCQGFSKNVPAAYRFMEDPRNLLFKEYLLFVDWFRPKVVIMENVAEINNAYNGEVREEIISVLSKMGYKVAVKVIQTHEYGVPQKRRRCVFFASNTGIDPHFPEKTHGEEERDTFFGEQKKYVSAWDAISDLPVLENGEGAESMDYDKTPQNEYQEFMRRDSHILWDHATRKLKSLQYQRIKSLKPGQGIKDLPARIRPLGGYSGAYGRLDFEMVSPTITRWVFHPGSGRYSHPREVRTLTMREAARIQSFSDDFRFTGTFTQKAGQIGNAVPPLLMTVLSERIMECCLGGSLVSR
ncbi:MAG: DNA cytosine methyltransferase [Candidatus Omnitrophica bacterium]|nr:DNA cytosine methyltransferase [Candidatus Omnitrophota bacterium]